LLPADITQATPEQQRAAFDQLNAANGQQLAGYGLPVTTGSLALAHLLGAPGARDWMQNRTLSPDASAANGGEEALGRRADQRLAMGAQGEMPNQFVRELPAVATPAGSETLAPPVPGINPGTEMASAAPAVDAGGAEPATEPKDAGDGAGWAKALEFAGKALSKMGRDRVGPDAASIVKPRTFAEPEAGEMLPRQKARAIAAILQRDMV